MLFEHADAVGDSGGSDAELLRGPGKALMTGSGVEEAQAVEGRERVHGAALYANHIWSSRNPT